MAGSYMSIANAYHTDGDLSYAVKYHKKAFRGYLKAHDDRHPHVADVHYNIAGVYRSLEFDKALFHMKALSIREEKLDTDHPDMAETYNDLGLAYQDRFELQKALEYHNKALVLRKRLYGDHHPLVAKSFNKINNTFLQEEFSKALEYNVKALDIQNSKFGEISQDVADTYMNMSSVYRMMEDYDRAIDYDEMCTDIEAKLELD